MHLSCYGHAFLVRAKLRDVSRAVAFWFVDGAGLSVNEVVALALVQARGRTVSRRHFLAQFEATSARDRAFTMAHRREVERKLAIQEDAELKRWPSWLCAFRGPSYWRMSLAHTGGDTLPPLL